MSLTAVQLQFFANYIQKELGIVYSSDNFFQLEKRLSDVAKALHYANETELYEKAQVGMVGAAKQLLLDVATNNETMFFRDPKIFAALENEMLPALLEGRTSSAPLRVWCAASSFGQEPYSLAMLFKETGDKGKPMPRSEIIATDISEAALTRAREGRYSQLEVQRGLPAPLLVKYFGKDRDDQWILKPVIRAAVQFKKQNLLDSFTALGTFDLVLCRNVLIYQKEDAKREIVNLIADRIATGGFLTLGAAESLLGISDRFEQICKGGAVYFRKRR